MSRFDSPGCRGVARSQHVSLLSVRKARVFLHDDAGLVYEPRLSSLPPLADFRRLPFSCSHIRICSRQSQLWATPRSSRSFITSAGEHPVGSPRMRSWITGARVRRLMIWVMRQIETLGRPVWIVDNLTLSVAHDSPIGIYASRSSNNFLQSGMSLRFCSPQYGSFGGTGSGTSQYSEFNFVTWRPLAYLRRALAEIIYWVNPFHPVVWSVEAR